MVSIVRFLLISQVTVALLMGSLAGCSRGGKKGGGGGVDGGGGDFIVFTQEEVEKAVNEAWNELIAGSPRNPLVAAYYNLYAFDHNADETRVFKILQKILGNGQPVPSRSSLSYSMENRKDKSFEEPLALTGLMKPKILKLVQDGLCNGPAHKSFLASVSRLDLSGEICISIFGLMRRATPFIKYDILALLAHEIAHLYGYDEEDARVLQKYLIANMSHITGNDSYFKRLELSRQFREEFSRNWGLVVFYEGYDGNAPKRLAKFGWHLVDVVNRYLADPQKDDNLHVSRPNDYSAIKEQIFNLRKEVDSLAEKIFVAQLENKIVNISNEDRISFRRMALQFIELEEKVYNYYFGHKWPERNKAVRTKEQLQAQRALILMATDPVKSLDKVKRPRLDCFGKNIPAPAFPVADKKGTEQENEWYHNPCYAWGKELNTAGEFERRHKEDVDNPAPPAQTSPKVDTPEEDWTYIDLDESAPQAQELLELGGRSKWPISKVQNLLRNSGRIFCPSLFPKLPDGSDLGVSAALVGSSITVVTAAGVFYQTWGLPVYPGFEHVKDCYFQNYDSPKKAPLIFGSGNMEFGETEESRPGQDNNDNWVVIRLANALPKATGFAVDVSGTLMSDNLQLVNVFGQKNRLANRALRSEALGQSCRSTKYDPPGDVPAYVPGRAPYFPIAPRPTSVLWTSCEEFKNIGGSILLAEKGEHLIAVGVVEGPKPLFMIRGAAISPRIIESIAKIAGRTQLVINDQ